MATFNYTYPAFNGDPNITNYAANLNYMLSSDARAFALAALVHTDGLNHPTRSAANLNEFYATGSAVIAAGTYGSPTTWTMVSSPTGDPAVSGANVVISAAGLWLIGGICNSNVNLSAGSSFWYLSTTAGPRYSVGAGDTTALAPRVAVVYAPSTLTMVAVPSVAATISFKLYGLRVANV